MRAKLTEQMREKSTEQMRAKSTEQMRAKSTKRMRAKFTEQIRAKSTKQMRPSKETKIAPRSSGKPVCISVAKAAWYIYPADAENFFTDTGVAIRKKGGIEPGPVYSILPAVLSAQPVLQLFPWEA